MAINPLLRSSQLRLIGLSSGMDTDSIVQQMLRIHQLKIDSQNRSKTLLQWKHDVHNSVQTDIKDFMNSFLTRLGANGMNNPAVYNSTIADLTGKNSSAVSIKTNTESLTGSFRIGQIVSLAKNSYVTSAGSVSKNGDGFKLSDKLGDLRTSTGDIRFDSAGEARVSINNAYITLNWNDSIDDINAKIAKNGGYRIEFNNADYLGREFSKVKINGKETVVYKDEFYSVDTNKALVDVAGLGINFDIANINVNGVDIQVRKSDMLSGINAMILASPDGDPSKTIQFDTARVNINGKNIELNINDTMAQINDKLIAAGGIGIMPDGSGNFTVDINGVQGVQLNTSYTFAQINTAIAAADGGSTDNIIDFDIAKVNIGPGGQYPPGVFSAQIEIKKDEINNNFYNTFEELNRRIRAADGGRETNTIKFQWAEIDVNGVSGVLVNETHRVQEINNAILRAGGTAADYIKLDGTDTINSIAVTEADFTRTLPKGAFDSGIIDRANAALKWLNFDNNGKAYIWINNGTRDISIEIDSGMTIEEMMQAVNNSSAGVTMTYSQMTDQFTIESKTAGARALSVRGLEAFGIYEGSYEKGSMAVVYINGVRIETDSNVIDSKVSGIRGVEITLNNTTAAGDEDTVVSLKRDATEAVEKIKTFVDAYNTLLRRLEDLVKETKSRDETTYKPLTDEEKSLMSDKQIEEWEAIAKKGLLRNDSGLQNLANGLRRLFYEKIESAGLSPAQLGLTTGAPERWDPRSGGQIILDEDALRAALENDPDKVMRVFMNPSEDYSEKGLTWRMYDMMNGYINGSQDQSIKNLENSIRRSNEQIDKLQKKMWEEEDKLYKKFAAMETALSKLQSQSDWMLAMLGANNNNNNR